MILGFVLIAAGASLAGVTLWFWRESRPDSPVLGPLEIMGERRFKESDDAARSEMLRQARTTVEP